MTSRRRRRRCSARRGWHRPPARPGGRCRCPGRRDRRPPPPPGRSATAAGPGRLRPAPPQLLRASPARPHPACIRGCDGALRPGAGIVGSAPRAGAANWPGSVGAEAAAAAGISMVAVRVVVGRLRSAPPVAATFWSAGSLPTKVVIPTTRATAANDIPATSERLRVRVRRWRRSMRRVTAAQPSADGSTTVRPALQRLPELVVDVHRSTALRSSARPRCSSDFTVPGRHPRATAMSASERSS